MEGEDVPIFSYSAFLDVKKKSLATFGNVIDLSKIHEVSYIGYKTYVTAFTSFKNLCFRKFCGRSIAKASIMCHPSLDPCPMQCDFAAPLIKRQTLPRP